MSAWAWAWLSAALFAKSREGYSFTIWEHLGIRFQLRHLQRRLGPIRCLPDNVSRHEFSRANDCKYCSHKWNPCWRDFCDRNRHQFRKRSNTHLRRDGGDIVCVQQFRIVDL